MISFFIVEVVSFHCQFAADASTSCIKGEDFFLNYLIVRRGAELLDSGSPAFRFQNALLQTAWPRRALTTNFLSTRDLSSTLFFATLFQRRSQTFPRQLAIHRLRTGILNRDADASRPVTQSHRGGNLVNVLTARSAGTGKCFLQVGFAKHR